MKWHKYFAWAALACMLAAIYTGYNRRCYDSKVRRRAGLLCT